MASIIQDKLVYGVGVSSSKSLRDRRILIDVGSREELNALSGNISAECGI